MARVSLRDVKKTYGVLQVIHGVSIDVADGEFVVIVGPSGCGKSTLLRMVAGLETISSGEIAIGERVVNELEPKDRDIAMVFQNYALYPHMSVYGNMAYGLRIRNLSKSDIDARVKRAAAILELGALLERKPRELSGGQRQRVAMGRAIVREPAAFLMDEPLSNLDAKMRVQVRAEIARIQRDLKVTTVYVTHDQSEAMTLGDRVCVMRSGVLQQVDRPQVLYDRPANLFVAGFIGSPAMNLVEAELAEQNGALVARFGPHELAVPKELVAERPALRRYAGRRVALGIRPEDIADEPGPDGSRLEVAVDIREDMGSEVFLHFAVDAPPIKAEELRELVGDEAVEAADALTHHHGSPFIAKVARGTGAREGERATLTVNTRLLHAFDLASGDAIAA